MFKLFARYASVGVVNTAIHWLAFSVIMHTAGVSQTLSNLSAFCIAVTFSFFANARWTFDSETTSFRYMLYVLFMGSMAAFVGWLADKCELPALFTLVVFSGVSLVCGFFYSKYIIFRELK
ncbi:GtrA family protein [Winslowiella iniecta]|uniref:Bactoprenol-linked glucose translocase n=1 Tax=Winslowiella iniecta TaxID=1560201 RepID=A0A0L7TBA6_9GAMM|nr:GtrA family protein [Winslowiella iniecta]KOC88996.1 translocase [Winslowiella iniecta]KOC92643.1 translocase [Winslowiella iniecta]